MAQPKNQNNLLAMPFEERLKSAQRGHAEAQVLVGMAYQVNYLGTKQNFKEAARWFRLAANQGHALGQTFLGKSYLHGLGVEQNFNIAYERFSTAAEQGEAEAQYLLASLLLDLESHEDNTIQKNPAEAYKWLSRSAQQDYLLAYAALASLYERGSGVSSDRNQARDWYKKSCDKGIFSSCEQAKRLDSELNKQAQQEELEDESNQASTEKTAQTAVDDKIENK